jgi:hypothetical protein
MCITKNCVIEKCTKVWRTVWTKFMHAYIQTNICMYTHTYITLQQYMIDVLWDAKLYYSVLPCGKCSETLQWKMYKSTLQPWSPTCVHSRFPFLPFFHTYSWLFTIYILQLLLFTWHICKYLFFILINLTLCVFPFLTNLHWIWLWSAIKLLRQKKSYVIIFIH